MGFVAQAVNSSGRNRAERGIVASFRKVAPDFTIFFPYFGDIDLCFGFTLIISVPYIALAGAITGLIDRVVDIGHAAAQKRQKAKN